MKKDKIEEIKKILRIVFRNHKIKCKYCKERIEKIKEFAWN